MAENKITLSQKDRISVWWRHQFLQGSWNYERMQNGGWCYSMIPAIKRLYPSKDDQIAALKRHMEFYNTHPYVSSPVIGVTLALEEDRANGAPVDDTAIQGVKVGMMGPLAGVGDPVFWFTARPLLGALGASLAMGGSILGPILFFVVWNVMRLAFMWYTQEFGYKLGTSITKDLSGGLMGKITEGASILGMFVIGGLVERWVSIKFTPIVSTVTQSEGAYIDWSAIQATADSSGVAQAIHDGVALVREFNPALAKQIREEENRTDHYEDILGTYLVKLSALKISDADSSEATMLLKSLNDFERIGDHALNLVESAEELQKKHLDFSDTAKHELAVLTRAVDEIVALSFSAFRENNLEKAYQVEPLEQVIDDLKEKLRVHHILRMQQGSCSIESGFVWSDLLTALERVGDHCSNIAGCVVDMAHHDMNTHESLRSARIENENFGEQYKAFAAKYSLK